MEYCWEKPTKILSTSPSTSSNYNSPPRNRSQVATPCAACKILRRRCAEGCILAPYFPPSDPIKFTSAHRIFGASNIIKFLQELPESRRSDAVSSIVYEANARLRDPVYGCAGVICQLQEQVSELQAKLAKAQAEIVNMQCQQSNLMTFICREMPQSFQASSQNSIDNFEGSPQSFESGDPSLVDDNSQDPLWDTLWGMID